MAVPVLSPWPALGKLSQRLSQGLSERFSRKLSQRPSQRIPQWLTIVAMALMACLAVLIMPSQASDIQVLPARPLLGDTLQVFVAGQNGGPAPTVTFQKKTYQTFAIGGNRFRALVPTTPLDSSGSKALIVNQSQGSQTLNVNLQSRSFPTQSIWLPPGKDENGSDFEFDRVDAFKALVTPDKFWSGPFLRPAGGPVTSIYGVRRYYNGVFAKDYYHRGVDYGAGYGSPVTAPAAGRIALVGREAQGFKIHGNVVGIDHGQGVESIMLHLSRIDVREGQMVKAGDVIGAIGATGAAAGPHLHWGLYVNGQAVDPVPWREQRME
jgi:murein DD-endopeptidase MepM/ murein hydrolase activator NlpD